MTFPLFFFLPFFFSPPAVPLLHSSSLCSRGKRGMGGSRCQRRLAVQISPGYRAAEIQVTVVVARGETQPQPETHACARTHTQMGLA